MKGVWSFVSKKKKTFAMGAAKEKQPLAIAN